MDISLCLNVAIVEINTLGQKNKTKQNKTKQKKKKNTTTILMYLKANNRPDI